MRPTTFKAGGTVYWTISTYDDAGVPVDADTNPSVLVYRNSTATSESVTVTKRSGFTGVYDCVFNPSGESEGDMYSISEAVTISGSGYGNNWNMTVDAPMRGTDNVSPAAIAGDVTTAMLAVADDFKADVSALATQSSIDSLNDFDPASDVVARVTLVDTTTDLTNGGSGGGPTAADIADAVWDEVANGHSTPASFGWYVQTIYANINNLPSGGGDATAANQLSILTAISDLNDFDPSTEQVVASNMRGTDGANTVAPDNTTINDINNSLPNNFGLMDIDATGAVLSQLTPEQIYLYMTSSSRNDAFKADVSDLATDVHVQSIINGQASINTLLNATIIPNQSTILSDISDVSAGVVTIEDAIATSVIPNQVTTSGFVLAVKAVTDKLDTMVQADGSNWQYTIDSLALAPTGSGGSGGSGDSAATIYNYFTSNDREDVFKADVSGLATSSSLTSAKNEIVTDIAGLNNFDPANDVVANVMTVQNVINGGGSGGGSGDATAANQTLILTAINELNDFDPDSDVVQNVQTVQTVINGGGGSGGGGGSVTVKAAPTPRAF